MKKILFLSFILLNVFFINATKNTNDEFLISGIGSDFKGIWLPEYFVESYKKSLNFASSYQFSGDAKNRPHDILIIEENRVWSNQKFHDSYGIKASDFKKFKLIAASKGKTISITDNNGNNYVKISDGDSRNAIRNVSIWLLSILNDNLKKNNKIDVLTIAEDKVTLRNTFLQNTTLTVLVDLFLLDRNNFKKEQYNLYLVDNTTPYIYGIKLSDKEITVDLISETYKIKDKTIQEMNLSALRILTF